MSRSPEYDKDIAEMYGTAEPSILFEFSADKRIAQAMGFGYAYYPQSYESRTFIDTLFGNGEQGVMYIPQPTMLGQQVLFQDSDGTTPVTMDGDPVGLMLDVVQGLDLVDNGTFDTDLSGWTQPNGTYQWGAGGVVSRTSTGKAAPFYQTVSTTPGKSYEVAIDVLNYTLSPVYYFNGGFDSSWKLVKGVNKRVFEATGTSSVFGLYAVAANITFTSISVREISANHATQPVSASRPLYRTDGSRHWNVFDAANGHLELPEIFGDEDNWVFAVAVRPLSASDTNPRYFSMVREGMNLQCGYINTGTVFTRVDDTTYNTNQKITLGQPYVIQHIRQGGVSSVRINGQELGFSPGTAPQANSQMGPALGAGYQAASFKLRGDIYGALYRHGTYTQEMAIEVDKYLAALAGVTL